MTIKNCIGERAAKTLIFCCGVYSANLYAVNWEITPEVSLREVYSDNIFLDGNNEESDLITDISPGLTVVGDGNRLDLQFDYRIQNLIYLDNSERNRTNHKLNSRFKSELLDDWLFFDATGRVSQQLVDIKEGLSSDRISGSQNAEDVYAYSLTPYITPRIGDLLEAEIRYTFDYVDRSNDNRNTNGSQSFNDSEGDTFKAYIRNGQDFGRFSWDINFDSRDVEYGDGDKTDTERLRANISYRLGRKWSLNLSGTDEENEFIGNRGNRTPDDSFYGGGFTWHPSRNFSLTAGYNERKDPRPNEDENFGNASLFWSPTPRTQLSADYGNRFFGETYNFNFSHKMRRSSWQIAYNESISDFRQQFLEPQLVGALICPIGFSDFQQCRIFDSNNPQELNEQVVGFVAQLPSISENTYINKRLNASWSIRGGRNVITLGVNRQDREFLGDGLDQRDLDVTLSWSYQVAPKTSSLLSIRHGENEFEDGDDHTNININWSLRTRVSAKSDLSLEFYYSDRDADVTTRDYSENRVTLSFRHLF